MALKKTSKSKGRSQKPAKGTSAAKKTKRPVGRTGQDSGMVKRLNDQLKVYKRIKKIRSAKLNTVRRQLDEAAFYPAHDKRVETSAYKKVHKELAITKDLPCLICGVRHSTLDDPKKNPYGAKAMETHHHVIEWALANAIDPGKFNRILLPNLRHRHPDREDYKTDFTAKQVAAWVDHDEHNLWVLCDVHHRAKYFGIHGITFPIWGPMDLLMDNFEAAMNAEIERIKKLPKKK